MYDHNAIEDIGTRELKINLTTSDDIRALFDRLRGDLQVKSARHSKVSDFLHDKVIEWTFFNVKNRSHSRLTIENQLRTDCLSEIDLVSGRGATKGN